MCPCRVYRDTPAGTTTRPKKWTCDVRRAFHPISTTRPASAKERVEHGLRDDDDVVRLKDAIANVVHGRLVAKEDRA